MNRCVGPVSWDASKPKEKTMDDPNMHAYGDDNDRLKPCPFCGAAAEIITLAGEDDPGVGAQCVQCTSSACGAASGLVYPLMDDVTDLLHERWNKRFNAMYRDKTCSITSET